MWHIRRLLTCLLLGAASTFAVSWTLELVETPTVRGNGSRATDVPVFPDGGRIPTLSVSQHTAFGRRRIHSVWYDQLAVGPTVPPYTGQPLLLLPHWIRFADPRRTAQADGRWHEVVVVESGWPLPAVGAEHEIRRDNGDSNRAASTRWGIVLNRSDEVDSKKLVHLPVLPLRVLPIGFVLNSLIFASILLALAAIATGATRLRRYARGACPECGFDRKSDFSSPCPECGCSANYQAS